MATFTNLLSHIVFSTKNRAALIDDGCQDRLYHYLGGITRSHGGTLLEVGGMSDHVHLLTRFKPNTSVSEMMRHVKSNSSKWMNELPDIDFRFGWQAGYGAFSVSESQVGEVRRYIRNQAAHHRTRTFKDELVGLLRKHSIEFDERYLWT